MPRPNGAKGNAKEAILGSLRHGHFPDVDFWGRTTVHVYSVGEYGGYRCSSKAGQRSRLCVSDPGEDHREYRFWAGFPLTVTNATQRDETNNQDPQIDVWVW